MNKVVQKLKQSLIYSDVNLPFVPNSLLSGNQYHFCRNGIFNIESFKVIKVTLVLINSFCKLVKKFITHQSVMTRWTITRDPFLVQEFWHTSHVQAQPSRKEETHLIFQKEATFQDLHVIWTLFLSQMSHIFSMTERLTTMENANHVMQK